MLPKIQAKKQAPEHYPRLLSTSNHDETILKLKILQQFLQEDTYNGRPTPLQHRKQFSLHTYRHNNQENLKRYIPNTSNELHFASKVPKKENIPPRMETKSRLQTKRECIRLNQLVEITLRQNEPVLFRRQLNFGNYKIL